MILSKNQEKIVSLFRRDLFLKTTIRNIMILLKSKSYARIHEAVLDLEKKGILKTEKFGQTKITELVLGPKTISLFSYLEENESLNKKIGVDKLLKSKELNEEIIILTGSYARGTQKKHSDIDLAIITKDDVFKKQKFIENLTISANPPIHPVVFSEKNFKDMLLEENENFGKETYKNKLVLKNSRRYFELIKEAIDNGFRGETILPKSRK